MVLLMFSHDTAQTCSVFIEKRINLPLELHGLGVFHSSIFPFDFTFYASAELPSGSNTQVHQYRQKTATSVCGSWVQSHDRILYERKTCYTPQKVLG